MLYQIDKFLLQIARIFLRSQESVLRSQEEIKKETGDNPPLTPPRRGKTGDRRKITWGFHPWEF
ncbi:MAG: hypothetical protein F6K18_23020 [Okeania sp. SIO2C2]|uniref:hypothetical protein n=1 Tax=Okeania sp. SIO2C2 TaxID=2607787 RepID=UPI0013BB1495|nr:hypothetical protein [Okeania sp. SIO2C2]NEP89469.1 hypothetical protein [Okeania sp. SIO2C2]